MSRDRDCFCGFWKLFGLSELENSQSEIGEIEMSGRQTEASVNMDLRLRFLGANAGIPNPLNHCFINSLLQCLLSLESLMRRLEKHKRKNLVAERLYNLLRTIDSEQRINRKNDLNELKVELFGSMRKMTDGIPIIQEKGGDSRTFFQTLIMSVAGQNPPKEDPIFQLFCNGDLKKKVQCIKCQTSQEYIENHLMLNVQEDLYEIGEQAENFFQSNIELRKCKSCLEKTKHSKKIILTVFPEILALRIAEIPLEKFEKKKACKTKITLKFQDQDGEKVEYEFVSGVYNTQRGDEGFHSVAYVRNKIILNGKGEFLMYSDEIVIDVKRSQIDRYPKLLFYKKIQRELSGDQSRQKMTPIV